MKILVSQMCLLYLSSLVPWKQHNRIIKGQRQRLFIKAVYLSFTLFANWFLLFNLVLRWIPAGDVVQHSALSNASRLTVINPSCRAASIILSQTGRKWSSHIDLVTRPWNVTWQGKIVLIRKKSDIMHKDLASTPDENLLTGENKDLLLNLS